MVLLARTALSLAALATIAAGCGASAAAQGPAGAASLVPGSPFARLFPAPDGHVYAYATRSSEGAKGMFVTRVRREASRVVLSTGAKSESVEVRDEGVRRWPLGPYLLKAPLEVGASWPGGEGASVKISRVDVAIDVPAGHFAGCVETIESREGAASKRVTTTFCPDVGIVALDVEAWTSDERAHETATLASFGPAVELGGERR